MKHCKREEGPTPFGGTRLAFRDFFEQQYLTISSDIFNVLAVSLYQQHVTKPYFYFAQFRQQIHSVSIDCQYH